MKSSRRKFSPDQKVAILKQHLLENIPISTVCDQHGIKPTQFYQWQKAFFDNGAAAFDQSQVKQLKARERQQQALQEKLQHKDGVIAEIMAELIAEKKRHGAS